MKRLADVIASTRTTGDRATSYPPPESVTANRAITIGAELRLGGNLDEARRYLLSGVQRSPTPFGLTQLGNLWRSDARPKEACLAFREALAIDPGNPWATVSLAAAIVETRSASVDELFDQFATLAALMSRKRRESPEPALRVAIKVLGAIQARTHIADIQPLRDSLEWIADHPGPIWLDDLAERLEITDRILTAHRTIFDTEKKAA